MSSAIAKDGGPVGRLLEKLGLRGKKEEDVPAFVPAQPPEPAAPPMPPPPPPKPQPAPQQPVHPVAVSPIATGRGDQALTARKVQQRRNDYARFTGWLMQSLQQQPGCLPCPSAPPSRPAASQDCAGAA